jgi:DNA processing protein
MISQLLDIPSELEILKKPPSELFFVGNCDLLHSKKISIVGTRRPISYTKEQTFKLAQKFSQIGYCIVSGAAMGVDAIAHRGSFPNTIAVMANSLDYQYPAVNRTLINDIYKNSLALSEYKEDYRATKYSFVIRNRIVVALGEVLIISEADENSGTMRSAKIALDLGKKIFVLPHRLGESRGTQKLLSEGNAELILDIDEFVGRFGQVQKSNDPFLIYCQSTPLLSEALAKFGTNVYEYELEGKIKIENLKVYLL